MPYFTFDSWLCGTLLIPFESVFGWARFLLSFEGSFDVHGGASWTCTTPMNVRSCDTESFPSVYLRYLDVHEAYLVSLM